MKKILVLTALLLWVISPFSQEYYSSSDTAQEKSEAFDTADANVEIFGYSSSQQTYQLLNPPPQETKKSFIIESPQKSYGTTGNSSYASIPPAPDRPIGKTVAGIILSIQGGATTIIGIFTLMAGAGSGGGNGFFRSLPIFVPGLGMLIPGSALVNQARSEWSYYNEWERKYETRALMPPTLSLRYSFAF